MLIGCGVWPQRYDPLINVYSDLELEQRLAAMAKNVEQLVAKLPAHDALLGAIRAHN
jgi:hypothetical protein